MIKSKLKNFNQIPNFSKIPNIRFDREKFLQKVIVIFTYLLCKVKKKTSFLNHQFCSEYYSECMTKAIRYCSHSERVIVFIIVNDNVPRWYIFGTASSKRNRRRESDREGERRGGGIGRDTIDRMEQKVLAVVSAREF